MAKKKRPPTPEEPGEVLRAIQRRSLKEMQTAYQAGAKIKLLEAAAYCGGIGLPLPSWVTDGLRTAYKLLSTCEVKTMDEAFGFSRPTGFSTKAWNHRLKLLLPVYFRVEMMRLAGHGLGDVLFSEVGEKFGISAKTASKYYYAIREHFGWMGREEHPA
jgi:hypothetical protein